MTATYSISDDNEDSSVKLSDLWLRCPHGNLLCAGPDGKCPGGRPVTLADLEGLGQRWWICGDDYSMFEEENEACQVHLPTDFPMACGWRILIPIPESIGVE